MAIQVSNFAYEPSEVEFLTHEECSKDCTFLSSFKMGTLVVESLDKVYPASEPAESDYVWEEAPWDTHLCADYATDECMYSWLCISCRKSYPVGDPKEWDSDQARCRCYDWTPYPSDVYEEKIYCPFYTQPGLRLNEDEEIELVK